MFNSLANSQPGQNLLSAVRPLVPPLLFCLMYPYNAHAYAITSSRAEFERGRLLAQRKASQSWLSQFRAAMPATLLNVFEELLTALRAVYLGLLFLPALLMAPVVFSLGIYQTQWLDLIKWTLQRSGPAFIKWGQWAATRPDLFPEELCDRLEQLQTSAPAHASHLSDLTVEAAFGRPVSAIFSSFEATPVASGSIAQIHRARLNAAGAALVGLPADTVVAVKVRHPHVSELMHRDFVLMQRAAALCSRLPVLRDLRLEESIRQFGGPLKEQLDLSVEALHLTRFNSNFRSWTNVSFPVPLYPLVSKEVLVESFEEGSLITRYVKGQHKHNNVLAQTGVDMFFKMMLNDNFIHADLHPGNILVREVTPASLGWPAWARGGSAVTPHAQPPAASAACAAALTAQPCKAAAVQPQAPCASSACQPQQHAPVPRSAAEVQPSDCSAHAAACDGSSSVSAASASGRSSAAPTAAAIVTSAGRAVWNLPAAVTRTLSWLPAGIVTQIGHAAATLGIQLECQPRIVLLDTGMIVELSQEDQSSLVKFFKCLTKMDGHGLGDAILAMSAGATCKHPRAFVEDIVSMFEHMDRETMSRESSAVFKQVIETMRQHQVTLRSSVSTVVVTSLVLEGWSSKLDPDVKIIDTLRTMLAADWADRISLAVDKIMASGTLAVA